MTETRIMGRELQDEVLNAVRKSQTAVVEAIQAWTSKVQSLSPELNIPFADQFADMLPKPQEFVGTAYDFAERMLASQRKFAEEVLHAAAPLMVAKGDTPARANGATTKK